MDFWEILPGFFPKFRLKIGKIWVAQMYASPCNNAIYSGAHRVDGLTVLSIQFKKMEISAVAADVVEDVAVVAAVDVAEVGNQTISHHNSNRCNSTIMDSFKTRAQKQTPKISFNIFIIISHPIYISLCFH